MKRAMKPLSVAGISTFASQSIPILVTQGPAMVSLIGNGTLAAITGFIVAGLLPSVM